jgi:sulfatase maturation enzyme AslB (radical SAM superfamily)
MTDKDKKQEEYYKNHSHTSTQPIYVDEDTLREDQLHKLTKSKVFCILPWIHLHAFPNGQAYPCCLSDSHHPIGNLHNNTMQEVWNSTEYKQIRANMMNEIECKECVKCYEREQHGFISMRNDSNKNFGHHINLVDETTPDGQFDDFKIRYYDIRFTNLCNMSCRTCGGWFSSSWYNEEVEVFGPRDHPQFMYAGRDKDDMWNQMQEHIPYLEQIYFAGGEPLIMEEHYKVLKELVRLERFDVKLVYNTNFSKLNLKDENVLDYWKLFKSVSIGASLDAMGPRAEYIRKGTRWDDIVRNRERMLETCPDVDFYVSSTVSLYNIFHVPDFHRDWVDRGLLTPQDWNINILQGPDRERIDVLPAIYKEQAKEKILNHIYWLGPKDNLKRATNGYKSMLKFLTDDNKDWLLHEFFSVNDKLDAYRKENFENVFPEYQDLRSYCYNKWAKNNGVA